MFKKDEVDAIIRPKDTRKIRLIINSVKAAGKYQGVGELKLDDPDVKWFLQYLKAPAGQSPMLFWVLSENGKAIVYPAISFRFWWIP